MKIKGGHSLLEILRLIKCSHAAQLPLRAIVTLSLIVAGPVASVFAPVVLGDAINRLSQGDGATMQSSFVYGAVAYVVLAMLSSCAPHARDALFAPVSESAMARAAVESFQHLLELSLDFHHSKQSGALSRAIDRGVRAIDVLIRAVLFNLAPSAIEFALAIGVMIVRLDWRFAVTALVGVTLYMLITHFASRWWEANRRRQNEAEAETAGVLGDVLINFETVKIFGAEQRMVTHYGEALQRYVGTAVTTSQSQSAVSTAQHAVMRISLAVIVTMAGLAVVHGRMRVGDIFTAILLLRGLFHPLGMLGYHYRECQQAMTDMEQLHALNDGQRVLPREHGMGLAISFESVSYQHDARAASALRQVSFTACAGSTVALVGPSGAGKTTAIRLMTRLIEPQNGCVKIAGVDLRELSLAALRQAVALVPQDVALFNDTLFQNIAFSRPGTDSAEVRAAAEAAELGPLIDSLPLGMNTLVGERGLKLSGGERQRVGIARALLADPQVLLLDEATSALDGPTEAAIQATLRRVKAGRTMVVIAHRLSTVVDADQILVIQQGRLIESGRHNDLLERNGAYAELWRHQTRESEPVLVAVS